MRFIGLLLVCCLAAQDRPPAEVERARAERDRVKALVDEGVASRKALQDAEAALVLAEDHSVLRSTLYGRIALEDLTTSQADAMVDAARRQLQAQTAKVEEMKRLVDEGVAARSTLDEPLQELERRRETVALAEERGRLFRELVEMAQAERAFEQPIEEAEPTLPGRRMDRYDGDGQFDPSHLRTVVLAFEKQFRRSLPVSARGETAVHKALGFDHRGRVDVALEPDSVEGRWLRAFLEDQRIPHYA
ncbi:MAG: hypothetical protein ACRD44_19725, partial [Bryobacteraceae bacterium]